MNIDNINSKIKKLNKLRKLVSIPINESDTLEEKVFKKYLQLESVTKVAEYLNSCGYRINSRKYIANDISSIITNKEIKIENKDLKNVVTKLFNNHKKGIKRSIW